MCTTALHNTTHHSQQGQIKIKLGLMLQHRKGPVFFLDIDVCIVAYVHSTLTSHHRQKDLACDTTRLNTVTYDYDINNIKLSNIRFSILSSYFNKTNVWFTTLFTQRYFCFKSTLTRKIDVAVIIANNLANSV